MGRVLGVNRPLTHVVERAARCPMSDLGRAQLNRRDEEGDQRRNELWRERHSLSARFVRVVAARPRERTVSHSSSTQAFWTL